MGACGGGRKLHKGRVKYGRDMERWAQGVGMAVLGREITLTTSKIPRITHLPTLAVWLCRGMAGRSRSPAALLYTKDDHGGPFPHPTGFVAAFGEADDGTMTSGILYSTKKLPAGRKLGSRYQGRQGVGGGKEPVGCLYWSPHYPKAALELVSHPPAGGVVPVRELCWAVVLYRGGVGGAGRHSVACHCCWAWVWVYFCPA